jgi:arginine N-succinyltransferase
MSFLVRSARVSDLNQLFSLAKQFSLLNLPPDKKILMHKLETSEKSFAGELDKSKAEYLFVVEDVDQNLIVGCSQIIAKHGSELVPHFAFQIIKKNHFSEDLGIGFIHQVLRLTLNSDGPSEIGGLLVDRSYRGRPEKLGRIISLIRFIYVSMHVDRFEKRFMCELAPPLTDDGKSVFWESVGRKFTGMSYQEADQVSQSHKEFISSLFPKEDIYLNLLDSQARLVVGNVSLETLPAQHMLEKIGFEYLNEVDPFDGGPHYGVDTSQISVVQKTSKYKIKSGIVEGTSRLCLAGCEKEGEFFGVQCAYEIQGNNLLVSNEVMQSLQLEVGDDVYMFPL